MVVTYIFIATDWRIGSQKNSRALIFVSTLMAMSLYHQADTRAANAIVGRMMKRKLLNST